VDKRGDARFIVVITAEEDCSSSSTSVPFFFEEADIDVFRHRREARLRRLPFLQRIRVFFLQFCDLGGF